MVQAFGHYAFEFSAAMFAAVRQERRRQVAIRSRDAQPRYCAFDCPNPARVMLRFPEERYHRDESWEYPLHIVKARSHIACTACAVAIMAVLPGTQLRLLPAHWRGCR